MSECQTKAGNLECMNVWMFWTTFVFMSMLKTYSYTFSLSLSLFLTLTLFQSLIQSLSTGWTSLYAQKSLFRVENCNAFFDTSSTLSCDIWVHRAGSQLKIDDFYSKSGNFLTWAGDLGVNSMATWPGNSQLAFNLQFDLTTSWQGQHNLQFASCLAGGGGAGACWVGSFECYILRYIERTVHCIEASRFSHNPPLRYR